jgi:Skp family chaperone for outer membrane proteins
VGFVDMQRLFKASPDAARAREGLEELVRQAEERVNAKKAGLLRLRQELGALKSERELLAEPKPAAPPPAASTQAAPLSVDLPGLVGAPSNPVRPGASPLNPTGDRGTPQAAPKPEPAAAPVAVSTPAAQPTTDLPGLAGAPLNPARPGASPLNPTGDRGTPQAAPKPEPAAAPVAVSTPAAQPTTDLPGLAGAPLNPARPGASPLNPARDRGTPQAAPKPEPAAAPVAVSTPAARAAIEPDPVASSTASAAPVAPAGPTLAQRLIELDGRISAKQGESDRLQGELDRERLGAERALLDAEGRKTDQVLARLYRAVSEVARLEGVSVVVDKSATLYGHPAVDLTDKIIKQLRGAPPPP